MIYKCCYPQQHKPVKGLIFKAQTFSYVRKCLTVSLDISHNCMPYIAT